MGEHLSQVGGREKGGAAEEGMSCGLQGLSHTGEAWARGGRECPDSGSYVGEPPKRQQIGSAVVGVVGCLVSGFYKMPHPPPTSDIPSNSKMKSPGI